ncbi:synaptotagmin-like protein 2 isoform X5 [Hypomesus transpacificus]|uniref:synaptotagmin-like protein 2 isoform X5 n=1 Tax=Hypomesus transpacificus TaxID=137520 RepID=UPI001F07B2B0|nr:synaptotagmin-like protein 2 isoform X5 [Hypomesus transpacificus]
MKCNRDLSDDLDLSFLSTDEEMAIRQVLQRDENLKRQETGRIRRLRLSIPDPKTLKVMTGEWFEELRTRRYGRQSDVTEVVRSSMRRKKTTVPRGSPYRDTRKTDYKGEDTKTDSQTKTSEFKTLNTSFLNPAFREEKVKLELSEEESAAHTDSAITKSSKVPAEVPRQQANQEAGKYPIPTILLNSSQSPITEEVKGLGHRRKVLEVSSVSGSSLGSLKDETVDSDDDHTSVSSQGSDFSDRQGYGSTLSLSHSGRTGSMLSVYSDAGDFGNVTVQGAVEFAMRYNKEGEFIVTVEQCLDLAFANARKQRTDPYVKTYLHPDKSHSSKKKTSIKKRTTNPVYGGETLKYKMKMEELKDRTLNLSVWHNDSRGRNVFLGQVEINLKTWDWGHEALTWYNLQHKNSEGQEVTENHGLLTVALKYLPPGSAGIARPDSGEIHVWLKEARELRKLKAQGVDSFVKCYMLPDTSKKSRQKTRVIKKSQEPVYNHAMVYDGFHDDEVREACCELTVWDKNKLSNQFLGGVRLSLGTGQSYGKKVDWMDSWDQEIGLWEKMLASPTSWVEGELPLRSAMTPRKKRL